MSVLLKQTHEIKTNDSFKTAPRPEYFGKSAVWEGNAAAGAPRNASSSRADRVPNERFSPLYAAVTFVDGVILPGETKRQTLSKRIVFKIPYSKSGKIPLPAIKLSFIIQQFCLKEKDSEALSEN